ncbi:MAG: hypothetical protein RL272_97 [Candidatus Parcubacteria bacterium]|jgi:hypothetical protein
MEDKLRKFTDDARGVALTAAEKATGRAILEQYMLLTPVRAERAEAGAKPAFRFAAFGLAGRVATVFSLVLGLMLSSAGVSYAAEGSLPGDALYPVKVAVNEELRAALAPTPEAKAAWEAERAERRLAEAEKLAKKGTLKTETRVSLEADFKRHSEKAQEEIAAFDATTDANAAANVSAHLEGSLRAHKKIIAALTEDEKGHSEVGELKASVDAETASTEDERGRTEAKVSERRPADTMGAAQGRRAAAEAKIAEVREYLSAKRDALGSDAVSDADARLDDAQAAIDDGAAKSAAGDFSGAFASFGKAQRLAQEAKLLIRARHDLQIRVKFDREDGGGDFRGGKQDTRGQDDRQARQERGGQDEAGGRAGNGDAGGMRGSRPRDRSGR